MNKTQNRKRLVTAVVAVALIACMAVGGTFAYLTDDETVTNTFTVGDVHIELLEPDYPGNDSPTPKDIVPNQEVDKNPQITNYGVNDAIVYMTVDSPMEKITVVNDDGTTGTANSLTEVFWFKDSADGISTHSNNFDAGWTELTAKEMYVLIDNAGTETQVAASKLESTYDSMPDTSTLVKRYVFAYNTEIQGSSTTDGDAQTAANKLTSALFDKIQLKNMIENEVDHCAESVTVRAYAIQSEEVIANNADLTDTLDAANLGKIYDIFVAQNSTGNDVSGLKVEGIRQADSVTSTADGESSLTDTHVNRWETSSNVTTPNNVSP